MRPGIILGRKKKKKVKPPLQLCPTLCNPTAAIPFLLGSQPRDLTRVYLHCRWILYHCATRDDTTSHTKLEKRLEFQLSVKSWKLAPPSGVACIQKSVGIPCPTSVCPASHSHGPPHSLPHWVFPTHLMLHCFSWSPTLRVHHLRLPYEVARKL